MSSRSQPAFDVAVHPASMTTANTDGWSKAGIMVRQDASNNSVYTIISPQTWSNEANYQWTYNDQGTLRRPGVRGAELAAADL